MYTFARRFFLALLPLLLVLGACDNKTDDMKELEKQIEEHKVLDDATIQKYLQDNNITNYERTSTGLYIVRLNTVTSGPQPVQGSSISVKYIGRRISDNFRFDASVDNGTPCGCTTFVLGSVIAGWNEAFPKLYKGQRALLLIPSHLAYSYQGQGGAIPAWTPLMFDVELINVGQ
ncbi:hypothetical protein B0919_20875 [Hymenobacter sp. CRA2]|nr:hypothetical protein B0919_20875 [Hymenobacter sp. CRA2]